MCPMIMQVETGVRLTHVPTGIAVKCTQERTQLANRGIAMDMLRAKLLVIMQEQAAHQVGGSKLGHAVFLGMGIRKRSVW